MNGAARYSGRVSEPRRTSRYATLAVLTTLYTAQGLVAGFAGFVLIPSLAAANVSLQAQTGLLALAGLPWVLKILWGPVLDRFGARTHGRARTIVAGAMLGVAATLAWMASGLSDGARLTDAVGRIQGQWLLLSVLLSLQDVATDALALDRVPPEDRGLANGFMLGGHHVGTEGIGGLALGATVVATGMASGLWAMAALFGVFAVAPMLLPAPDDGRVDAAPAGSLARAVRAMVETPRARIAAGLAVVIMVGDVVTASVSGQFWVHRLGWSVQRVTTELPPLLLVANVAGYAAAAAAVDRLGHAKATAAGAIALGVLWIGFGAAEGAWSDEGFLRAFVVVQGLATALMYVGVHALLMDAAVPRVRATHFTLLMALLNLPRAIVPGLAPDLLGALDFAGLFVACGLAQVLIGVAAGYTRGQSSAASGSGSGS